MKTIIERLLNFLRFYSLIFSPFCYGVDNLQINVTEGKLRANYNGTVGDGLPPQIYLYHLPKDQSAYVEPELPSKSWNATEKLPLSINAWTDNSALSFTLPMTIDGSKFHMARRFFCPVEEKKSSKLYVSVSSESEEVVEYRLQVRSVEKGKFIIDQLDRKSTDFSIGPAWPDAFQFIFPEGVEVVDIIVEAVPDDREVDQAAIMFIQEPTCPLISLLEESDKAYRTIMFTRRARTTLVKSESYPSVFLSFVATKNKTKWTEKKKIHLTITKSGSDMSFRKPIGIAVGVSVFIFLVPAIYIIAFKVSGRRGHDELPSSSVQIGEGEGAHDDGGDPVHGDFSRSRDRLAQDPEGDDAAIYPQHVTDSASRRVRLHWINLSQSHCVVSAIAAMVIMIFFAITLSSVAENHKSGKCYFNYDCVRYLKSVPAFNHVFSYGFAYGACAFAISTYVTLVHWCFPGGRGNGELKNLRPVVSAVVICLVAQAFISSLYQSCPLRVLHFFENSFLILALLFGVAAFSVWVKLYEVITLWSVVVVFGAFSESLHIEGGIPLAASGTVTVIMILGYHYIEKKKVFEEKSYRQLVYSPAVYVTLVWCLFQSAAVAVFVTRTVDYAEFISISAVIGSCLYMGYHISQKRNRESFGHFLAIISLSIIGLVFWIIGFIFYLKKSVDVLATPAISRSHNGQCLLTDFFDGNDVWAFCSAYAIFFQFMPAILQSYLKRFTNDSMGFSPT